MILADTLYSSVDAITAVSIPPKAKAAVCKPAPAKVLLAVPKLDVVVQVVPSYFSVVVTVGVPVLDADPPKAKADV
jgi:hypothetical protein